MNYKNLIYGKHLSLGPVKVKTINNDESLSDGLFFFDLHLHCLLEKFLAHHQCLLEVICDCLDLRIVLTPFFMLINVKAKDQHNHHVL